MTTPVLGAVAWCIAAPILGTVIGRAIRHADQRRTPDALSAPRSFATGDTGPTGRPAATESTRAATDGAQGIVVGGDRR